MVECSDSSAIIIDHDNLPNLLGCTQQNDNQENPSKLLGGLWDDENIKTARAYYQALKQDPIEKETGILGHCYLWIKEELNFPQSVAILRRGMKITDDQPHLKRWDTCSDFVAVCMCDSDEGNALLRRMENPAHDAFEYQRLGKDSGRGRKALRELTEWIRSEVKKITEEPVEQSFQLDTLSDYFPSEDDDLPGENSERDFDGSSIISLTPTSLKPQNTSDVDDDEEGNGGEGTEEGSGSSNGGGTSGDNGGSNRTAVAMKIESIRVIRTKKGDVKHVRFTPKETGVGVLSVKIAGDSFTERVGIKNIDGVKVKKTTSGLSLNVEKDKRIAMNIELSESTDASLSITLTQKK